MARIGVYLIISTATISMSLLISRYFSSSLRTIVEFIFLFTPGAGWLCIV